MVPVPFLYWIFQSPKKRPYAVGLSTFPIKKNRKKEIDEPSGEIFGKTDWMALLSVFPVEKMPAWSLHAVSCKNLNHTV